MSDRAVRKRSSSNYLTPAEVADLGLASAGVDVQISRDARLFGVSRISLGDHVRIDAFTLISAGAPVTIGNYVHIAPFCSLSGQGGIILEDFSGLSGRVSIYSSSDDYSGRTMTNPTVPAEFKDITSAQIHIGRHVIIGAGAVLLPGASIGEGSAVGALCLVSRPLPEWKIFAGNPLRLVGKRQRDLLDLKSQFLEGVQSAASNCRLVSDVASSPRKGLILKSKAPATLLWCQGTGEQHRLISGPTIP